MSLQSSAVKTGLQLGPVISLMELTDLKVMAQFQDACNAVLVLLGYGPVE